MPDPVSWLMIEQGWFVFASGGEAVGRIYEVLGDPDRDIFDGLSVDTDRNEEPHYVAAEHVGVITEGVVRLKIPLDQLG
jgi:hypothetical protein